MFMGLFVALLVILADQVSKFYVMTYLMNDGHYIGVTSFFNVIQAWNTGVSFSMFNDGGKTGLIILSLIAVVVVIFLLRWMYKDNSKLIRVALGMIVGGAIGNLIDRIRYGAVYDFLDFHVSGHHWPAFNVADSFICIGAFLIIVYGMFSVEKRTKGE